MELLTALVLSMVDKIDKFVVSTDPGIVLRNFLIHVYIAFVRLPQVDVVSPDRVGRLLVAALTGSFMWFFAGGVGASFRTH